MNSIPTSRGVALLGGSGHAHSVADVVERLGHRVELIIAPESSSADWPDRATDDELGLQRAKEHGLRVVLAVGDNELRSRLLRLATAGELDLSPLVASTATCAPSAFLDIAVVVMEHCHIGPRARIGRGSIVNTSAVIEHDATVGECSHVAPGAVLTGGVRVGDQVLIGAGAVIMPSVEVGDRAVVAAGALVHRDVRAGATVAGVPAIERRPS